MKCKSIKTITREELVKELHRRGYHEITGRRIIDWQEKRLLPPFNVTGRGRGKSRGRECSAWSDGQQVIDQSECVYKLLKIYRSSASLHLPLWMLGYEVPLAHVREALARPLHEITNTLEEEAGTPGDIEDIIGDAAYEFTTSFKRTRRELFHVPQDVLETCVNIFFNPDYDLSDAPFETALEVWREWEGELQKMTAADWRGKAVVTLSQPARHESANTLFAHATFFKQYLSVHQLKKAADECTDADLRAVERDLGVLREIGLSIRRMVLILTRELPAELEVASAHFLPAISVFGRMLVLADLSLRRNGFAELIDRGLDKILSRFRQELNERFWLDLVAASQDFADTVRTYSERVVEA